MQHLTYRGAVHLSTDDGQLAGTFYARLIPLGGPAAERDRFGATALPDLRNFSGSLPLRLSLERAHLAYLYVFFALSRDGSTSGFLEPSAQYYDAAGGFAQIGADASWNDGRAFADQPLPGGAVTTLSDYPGSRLPPLVGLSVRADAVDPEFAGDVDVSVSIDGQIVREATVAAGTIIELGEHPFGTRVSVDVINTDAASRIRANILQDEYFVASIDCTEPNCTAHAEHTARANRCQQL